MRTMSRGQGDEDSRGGSAWDPTEGMKAMIYSTRPNAFSVEGKSVQRLLHRPAVLHH